MQKCPLSLVTALLCTLAATFAVPISAADRQKPTTLLVGDLVRDTGETFDISVPTGKIRVVNFWATWCLPCIKEMPTLVALAEAYADQPLEVLLINQDPNGLVKGRQFLIDHGWDQGVVRLYDAFGRWMHTMQVRVMPSTFIVDQHNRILDVIAGDRDWMAAGFHQQLDDWLLPLK